MIVGLDIDGTCFTHEYPKLGKDIGAFPWLLKAQALGAQFIIFTMRDGAELKEAVVEVDRQGVKVIGINTNPEQSWWTQSPKAYCHLYIDDNGLGMPLLDDETRAVDWEIAGHLLIAAVKAWNKRHPNKVKKQVVGPARPEIIVALKKASHEAGFNYHEMTVNNAIIEVTDMYQGCSWEELARVCKHFVGKLGGAR